MFETGAAKGAGFFAALATASSQEGIKSVLRLDPETVCGFILIYIFVIAPATMGREYSPIMGDVVENAWPLALAYIAPLTGRMGERVIDAFEKHRTKRNGKVDTVQAD